jgi:hypothetical protein
MSPPILPGWCSTLINGVVGSVGLNEDDDDYICYGRPLAGLSPDDGEQPPARATTPAFSYVPRRLRSGIEALVAQGEHYKLAMEAALLRADEAETALEKYQTKSIVHHLNVDARIEGMVRRVDVAVAPSPSPSRKRARRDECTCFGGALRKSPCLPSQR